MSDFGPDSEHSTVTEEEWVSIARSINVEAVCPAERRKIDLALFSYAFENPAGGEADPADDKVRKSTPLLSIHGDGDVIDKENYGPRRPHKVGGPADEREALRRFVVMARQFRSALARIQGIVDANRWHEKIEQLYEGAYQLQSAVDCELRGRPKSKGGRPSSEARDTLLEELGISYHRLTGNPPGQTVDPDTGVSSGPFVDFVTTIFGFQRISLVGLKHAISKLTRNPKYPI